MFDPAVAFLLKDPTCTFSPFNASEITRVTLDTFVQFTVKPSASIVVKFAWTWGVDDTWKL